MDTITEVRQQLDTLLARMTADHQALQQREQQVAQAAEQLSQEPAIAAAWQQGGAVERNRVVALIDHQLDQLSRGGINTIVLTALRRMVLEVEA
jgi:carbonic anhydrase